MKKIFTNLFLLAAISLAATTSWAQCYVYGPSEEMSIKLDNSTEMFTIPENGLEGVLSYKYRLNGNASFTHYATAEWSADGNSWNELVKVGTKSKDYGNVATATVPANAKYFRITAQESSFLCSKTVYVTEVKIESASYIKAPNISEWTATKAVGSSPSTTVATMKWCYTPEITYELTGDGASQFSCTIDNNAVKDCGAYGIAKINISYDHEIIGKQKATLSLTSNGKTYKIELIGETTKKAQIITWDEQWNTPTIPIGKTVENAAKTISPLPIKYKSSNDTVIQIVNDSTAFKAIAVGTATITAIQEGDEEWSAVSAEKEFTVTEKKIQTIVWNDNLTRLKTTDATQELTAQVYIILNHETNEKKLDDKRTALLKYESGNTNVVSVSDNILTIVGEGETTLTASIEGDENYEATSVTVPVKVRQPSAGCEDELLVNEPNEVEFFQMNLYAITKDPIKINTSVGVPDKLTFQYYGKKWGLNYKGTIKAQQSTDGGNSWADIASGEVTPIVDEVKSITLQLDSKATHIRFMRPANGEGYHYVKGIVVTPAQYLETSISSITENAVVGDVITRDITINYSNVKDEVLIAHNEDVKTISLSKDGLGNDCGDFGSATFTVTIVPTELGTITDNIVISDAVSKMNVTIPVTVNVRRNTQTILWNNADAEILTTADITFDAEAKTNITYTSSNTEVADVDVEGNKLVIKTEGEVIITATAAEDNKYEAATLTKKYIISKATPAIVSLPTVEAITYGATLGAATLNGGETDTEGTWQWNADLTQVLNAGTHELAVQFIPTNTAWYNTLDSKVTVTVNKADQTIAWDFTTTEMTVDEVLTLSATATAGEVTFALTDDAATLEGNTLTAVKAGEVTITASQAGNDNYNAAEEVAHTITIHKATPTVTAWPTLNDVVYGATYGEALQLVGGEASVEGAFSITNMPADLAQVPAVGEYTFGILFTPAKAESYNEVSDSVTLQVTKQLQTIAWDFADQELLIGNTLTLSATAPAGEVSFAIQPAEGVASLEGNTLTALAAGTVTITATAPENENYEAATISHIVTVIKHTPEIITLPTVAPLGHGTALTDDRLNGGESNIEGTWSFVNPTQSLNIGNNEVAIRFTPTNTDLYNTIDATITIVVEKAETIIYWELESNILYLNDEIFLYAETANGKVITTFEITGPQGILQYDSEFMSLTAIGYGTTEVTAYYPETETHKAAELSYEITVFDPNSETTGITNTTITGKDTEKVFINGQLFIIRNNQWYDTTGKLVK